MTDAQLILEWNELKNKRCNQEEVTWEEVQAFNEHVQQSYDAGTITKAMALKYAELICYLGTE